MDTLDIVDLMDPNEHIPHDLSDNLRLAPRSGPVGLENDGRNGMKGKNVPRPLPLILSEPSACLDLDRGGSTADSHLEVSHNSSVVNNGVSFQPSCASSPKKKIKWSLDINFDKTLGIVNSMDSPHDTSNTAINGATDRKSENTLLCQTDRNTYWQTRKSVKVAVRVRPPLKQEIESKFTRVVSFANNQDDTRERVCIMNPTVASVEDPDEVAADISSEQIPEWARLFEDMDHCFWSYGPVDSGGMYVKQRDVHQAIGAEIVYHAWNGMSSTCVCYGQTNSGTCW